MLLETTEGKARIVTRQEVVRGQQELCRSLQLQFVEAPFNLKIGVAENVRIPELPLNGLRHDPQGDTTGWYVWGGEVLKDDPDFFLPLHVEHLLTWCPMVLPYLGLPPGSRFLVASDFEDVWQDPSLLEDSP